MGSKRQTQTVTVKKARKARDCTLISGLIRKDLCPYQQSSLLPEQKAALNDLSKEALSVVEKMEDILRPEQQEHGGMRFG